MSDVCVCLLQILKTAQVASKDCKRDSVKTLHNRKIAFPLCHKVQVGPSDAPPSRPTAAYHHHHYHSPSCTTNHNPDPLCASLQHEIASATTSAFALAAACADPQAPRQLQGQQAADVVGANACVRGAPGCARARACGGAPAQWSDRLAFSCLAVGWPASLLKAAGALERRIRSPYREWLFS